jgi:leader peptidase (prepilin peptidase)/N-methyltransferase
VDPSVEDLTFIHQLVRGPFGWVAAGLWGAVWSSFFNVLIIRLPQGESVVRPASHCRVCGQPIPWHDNIPILGYLLLRGRCRRCGARFSARYLLVELVVTALALGMYYLFVVRPGSGVPVGLALARFVITSLFCGLLVAITFIDLDTLRIPDAITYPGIPCCMLLSLFMGTPHRWDGVVGGVGGYLGIRLIADGYQLITGRVGMGYGDAKLLAMIGGLLGWQVLLPVLFASALQGTLIGVTVLVVLRRRRGGAPTTGPAEGAADDEEAEEQPSASLRHARLPFGPFLSLAALEVLLAWDLLPLLFPYLW